MYGVPYRPGDRSDEGAVGTDFGEPMDAGIIWKRNGENHKEYPLQAVHPFGDGEFFRFNLIHHVLYPSEGAEPSAGRSSEQQPGHSPITYEHEGNLVDGGLLLENSNGAGHEGLRAGMAVHSGDADRFHRPGIDFLSRPDREPAISQQESQSELRYAAVNFIFGNGSKNDRFFLFFGGQSGSVCIYSWM